MNCRSLARATESVAVTSESSFVSLTLFDGAWLPTKPFPRPARVSPCARVQSEINTARPGGDYSTKNHENKR